MKPLITTTYILGFPVTSLRLEEQISLILTWAKKHKSKVVYLANTHMLMEAYWNEHFAKILQKADLVSPDGMPLVWMLRLMGIRNQNRVAGMDVFLNLCRLASISGVSVFFVGSEPETLNSIKKKLKQDFPLLSIAGMESLPFRPLTTEENRTLVAKINSSNAGLVFVCLGCPKQEHWMAQQKDLINGVMIGVGAVFAVYAGLQKRAPRLIRELGLEWLYRLGQEPFRLWSRYSKTIPPFLYLALKQLLWQKPVVLRSHLLENTLEKSLFELLTPICQSEKIGQMLLKQKLITECDLAVALKQQQQQQNKKIGEILLDLELVQQQDLEQQLKNQRITIGEILIEKKIISSEKLNELLLEQAYRQKGIKI
jgi:N-acetylglucosaminyldiphosphoundecaprenol N-acetyl-beta-D-mannosaminyltransferase